LCGDSSAHNRDRIDPDYLELIFRKILPDWQSGAALHRKTTFKGGGPGLGLSIAAVSSRQHGGRIWAESAGHDETTCPGSCFHILLPVASSAARGEILLCSPLRDNIPSRSLPLVNLALIALNALVFIYQTTLSLSLEQFDQHLRCDPSPSQPVAPVHLDSLMHSNFLHGGWFHLISNMWVLFIFGDNIEDRMGHFRYLGFYLLGGVLRTCCRR